MYVRMCAYVYICIVQINYENKQFHNGFLWRQKNIGGFNNIVNILFSMFGG